MQGGNQGGEFIFLDILEFVDKQDQGSLGFSGGQARDFQQCLKILFKIAVVRQAGFRFQGFLTGSTITIIVNLSWFMESL